MTGSSTKKLLVVGGLDPRTRILITTALLAGYELVTLDPKDVNKLKGHNFNAVVVDEYCTPAPKDVKASPAPWFKPEPWKRKKKGRS